MILTLHLFLAIKKRKPLGGPSNSNINEVYKYQLALAERRAGSGWKVSCKHSIAKAATAPRESGGRHRTVAGSGAADVGKL